MNKNKYLLPFGVYPRTATFNKTHYKLNNKASKLKINSINKLAMRFNEIPYLINKAESNVVYSIFEEIMRKKSKISIGNNFDDYE